MPDYSLINLGEFTKPATVLVERVSDAVGGIFKPGQIVRVAKAEAEAQRIQAEAKIQIDDLQRRSFNRFLQEEAKKQKNIEEITQKALPDVNEQATPENIDEDWITNFFDRCRLISDSEMQSLWSRVLAGEANSPNTYSKRTVNFLSSLDKGEAELFTKVCNFCWTIDDDFVPLIYDVNHNLYHKNGINFGALTHLDSIGLIQCSHLTGFQIAQLPKIVNVFYYGESTRLEFQKESENSLQVGTVVLTKIGQELAPICGSSANQEFLEFIREQWKKEGYIKEEKRPSKTEPKVPSQK